MPLNIDPQQILLHLFNMVLLFGILYILLYKPVHDFMDKREEEYRQRDKSTKDALADAERLKTFSSLFRTDRFHRREHGDVVLNRCIRMRCFGE